MIKLPKDFIAADYKFDFAIPKEKVETVKTPEGFIFRAGYEANEIQKFIQYVAHEMNEKIEVVIMDELLRLNGYVPERTCKIIFKRDRFGLCSCGQGIFSDMIYCSRCGAKVPENLWEMEDIG